MTANEMIGGLQYRLHYHGRIRVVEYARPSSNHEFAIVHERGELDLQSSFGIPWEEEVHPVDEECTSEGKCPGCGQQPTQIPPQHPNPVCRQNQLLCDCGWMGRYSTK